MRRVAADGSGWPFACRTNRPNPSVRQQVSTQGGGPELTLSLPQAVVETSRAAFKSSIHVSHRSLLSLTVRRPQGSVRQLVVRPPSTVRGKSAVTEDERTEDERDSDKAAWRHRTPELNIVSHGVNVSRAWVLAREKLDEPGREILVEEKLHEDAVSFACSRSAAYASDARMSSFVRYGKSRRISSSLIPEAR